MKNITVVIPWGGEGDHKLEAVKSLSKMKNKINISVEKGKDASINRNRGIKKSNTEIIAFLCSHTSASSNWIKQIKIFFRKNPDVDIVGGPQLTVPDQDRFGKIIGYGLGSLFGSASVRSRYIPTKAGEADEKMLTSANLACRKKVFDKALWDPKSHPGDDAKFLSDAKKAGFKIAYSPDLIVYHRRRSNLNGLFLQVFGYGDLRVRTRKFFELFKNPVFITPLFFLLYILLIPLLYYMGLKVLSLIPLFLYLILLIYFTVFESVKKRDGKALFILPLVFLAIHMGYGLGLLAGLINKIIK